MEGVCECLVGQEERLNELDRVSGDGDCGSTFKAGCVGRALVSPWLRILLLLPLVLPYMYIYV